MKNGAILKYYIEFLHRGYPLIINMLIFTIGAWYLSYRKRRREEAVKATIFTALISIDFWQFVTLPPLAYFANYLLDYEVMPSNSVYVFRFGLQFILMLIPVPIMASFLSKIAVIPYSMAFCFYALFETAETTAMIMSEQYWQICIFMGCMVLIYGFSMRNEFLFLRRRWDDFSHRGLIMEIVITLLLTEAVHMGTNLTYMIEDRPVAFILDKWMTVLGTFIFVLECVLIYHMVSTAHANVERETLAGQLQGAQEKTILAFAQVIERKSPQTGQHVRRVSEYSALLARELGFDEKKVQYIRIASMMHDIGKIMIPNEILEKPTGLTQEEFEIMKKHVDYGRELLSNQDDEIMHLAQIIASEHHERWDGEGYTRGLMENQIDISAQIVAVADAFDALTSKRTYKDAWPAENARNEILAESGKHFSPTVVNAFNARFDDILFIHDTYRD